MQRRLYKVKVINDGYTPIITTDNSDMRYLEFGRIFLSEKGCKYESNTGKNEAVISIFSGTCRIEIESPLAKKAWDKIGRRIDVFSGKPYMIYLPRKTDYSLVAKSFKLDVGLSMSPSKHDYLPAIIKPEDVIERNVGSSNWKRKVYTAVGDNIDSERLLVGETLNPPGNWSSSPPHKHDKKNQNESPMEEIYYFKVKPDQGFGLQRIYTSLEDKQEINEVYVVENNDTVVIPRGYHPVVAAPGYQLYYLWILAGDERKYGAWSDDPKHSWLKDYKPNYRIPKKYN